MRLTLKAVNDELARRGYTARLTKSTGCFDFQNGEAASWLDRTVNVPTLNSLTRPEWIAEFELLKKVNAKDIRSHRSSQYSALQPDKLSLPDSRLSDSGVTPNPSTAAKKTAGRILGKGEMVKPRRKQKKSRRERR